MAKWKIKIYYISRYLAKEVFFSATWRYPPGCDAREERSMFWHEAEGIGNTAKHHRPKITKNWEELKLEIRRVYMEEGKSLGGVRAFGMTAHSFDAS